MAAKRRFRIVILGTGVLLLVSGGSWALFGGPAAAVVAAIVGLVLVVATAPFADDGPSPGSSWESGGPFT